MFSHKLHNIIWSCGMPRQKRFLRLEAPDKGGFTLELLCDICKYAEENFKELKGIRPLQRVEAGFGIPKKPGDEHTYYKAVLTGGKPKWRKFSDAPFPCDWNLWIPDNWETELPRHKLYKSSITSERPDGVPMFGQTPEHWNAVESYLDSVQYTCTGFAYSKSKIQCSKEGVQVIYLNCDCMDNRKKRRALERVLTDMGLCK